MSKQHCSFWLTPQGLAALGLIGAVSYFLFMEHREHLFQYLPFLILLLCPLMHVFMHRGLGHGRHQNNDEPQSKKDFQKGYEEGLKATQEQKKLQKKEL